VFGYRVGLKPNELYDTTLYDLTLMAEAHNKRIEHDYDVMRREASLLLSAWVGKGDRNKIEPKTLLPLPSDKQEPKEQKLLSKQERRYLFRLLDLPYWERDN